MPVSMMPLKVSRSTNATQSLGSVNVFVQPENDSFDAIVDRVVLLPFSEYLEEQFRAAPVEFHITEFIDHEQVDPAVAGDGPGEVLLICIGPDSRPIGEVAHLCRIRPVQQP